MKPMAAFAILFVAATTLAGAEPACRKYDAQPLSNQERVIYVERGNHATIDLESVDTDVSLAIEGTLCRPDGSPIGGARVVLARYKVLVAGVDEHPSAAEFERHPDRYPTQSSRESPSGVDGRFRFLGVYPGNLALQVDWARIPDEVGHVVFDLRWVEAFTVGFTYGGD